MKTRLRRLNQQPFVTDMLIVIMVIVFLLMSLSGGSQNFNTLVAFGGEVNPLVKAGQWWRLITPIFIHIGFQHILLNCITLYFVGRLVELTIGHLRYLIVFLTSGIFGNLFSFAFGANVLSAGSSTAIFGLFGSFLLIAFALREHPFFQQTGKTFLLLVALNLISDLFLPGIDVLGHLGGFLGGILATGAVGIGKPEKIKKIIRIIYATALFIGIIILYYLGAIR